MDTLSGKAKITIEDHVIPGMADGANVSEPITAHTMDAALKVMAARPGYLGFIFAKSVQAKITPDDGGDDIIFTKLIPEKTVYTFAKKVVSLKEFTTAAEYKPAYDSIRQYGSHHLDGKSVIYERETSSSFPADRISFLPEYNQKDVVLINKQGQQLWPVPNKGA